MFAIRFKKKAYKELFKLPSLIIKRIAASIEILKENPHPEGSKRLRGSNENL